MAETTQKQKPRGGDGGDAGAAKDGVQKMAKKGEALKVAKLNIDDNPDATRQYGVMSIPSLILFKGGQEVARVIGARPKDAILKDVEPHLA